MKGLLDDVNAFDVEMSRLSVDGLILIAHDGKHFPPFLLRYFTALISLFPSCLLSHPMFGYRPYRCAPSRYHSTSNTPNLHHLYLHHQPNLKTKPHNDNSNTRRINTQHITQQPQSQHPKERSTSSSKTSPQQTTTTSSSSTPHPASCSPPHPNSLSETLPRTPLLPPPIRKHPR